MTRITDDPVAQDIPCERCGYNLRTLLSNALCPECAHPVNTSITSFHSSFVRHPRRARNAALFLALTALQEPFVSIAFSFVPVPTAASSNAFLLTISIVSISTYQLFELIFAAGMFLLDTSTARPLFTKQPKSLSIPGMLLLAYVLLRLCFVCILIAYWLINGPAGGPILGFRILQLPLMLLSLLALASLWFITTRLCARMRFIRFLIAGHVLIGLMWLSQVSGYITSIAVGFAPNRILTTIADAFRVFRMAGRMTDFIVAFPLFIFWLLLARAFHRSRPS